MQGINKVILVGNLGQDPEVKIVGNMTITNCSIATSERYKDKATGEIKTITEWHKVVFFNKLAEIVRDFLTKGASIYVEGKLKTEKYTDKDGIDRYTTKIIANNLQMLSGKKKEGYSNNSSATESAASKKSGVDSQEFDDDIPF